MEGDDALRLEAQGVLDKYSSGVIVGSKWQRRYVRCQRDLVEIHHYKGVPPARGAVPSRMVDLQQIDRMVARPDTLTIELFQRRDGARAVLLRAESVAELEFWAQIFKAKIEYLKAQQEEEGVEELQLRFATNTGTMLALMDEQEVEQLAETAVEEAFADHAAGADTHAAAVPGLSTSPRAAETSDEEAAPSWAVDGDSPIRTRASDAADNDDDDVKGGRSSKAGAMMTMERAVAGVGKVLRVLEGVVSDLETEVCAVACAGDDKKDEAKKVALIDRLFASYYGLIEDRLVLEVATTTPLGEQQQQQQDAANEQSVGSLMAALACWRRVRRYEERLRAVQLPVEEEGLRAMRRRLEGGCGLTGVLVPEPILIGCVVSSAVREVEGAWSREVQGLERYYASNAGTGNSSSTTTVYEEPSPRRFSVLTTRRRPLSATMTTAAAARAEERRPTSLSLGPCPCFSSAIAALERLLAGVEPWPLEDNEEDEEARAADRKEAQEQAAFLRVKAFMSAMLFLAGQVAALPLQVRSEADSGVVLAVVEDLGRCQERVAAVRQHFFVGGNNGGGGGGGGGGGEGSEVADMGEVAGVFAQAVERLSASAGALLLDHALSQDEQLQTLLGMVFVHPSWRRGEVTPLLVERFRRVLEGPLLDRLPPALAERAEARLLRTFLVLYLRQLLRLPARTHTHPFEAEDAMASLMDETAVQEWVDFRGRWASRPQRLADLWVLKRIRIWLLMPATEALDQYAEAWLQQAHPTLGPHLYDLLRFCLLLRKDVDAAAARTALLHVAEFVSQMGAATGRMAASPPPVPSPAKILLELFPRAGIQHITGEAWRWEAPAGKEEREALAGAVGPLVLRTCEKLRAPKPATRPPLGNGASPERMPVLQLPVLVPAVFDGRAETAAVVVASGAVDGAAVGGREEEGTGAGKGEATDPAAAEGFPAMAVAVAGPLEEDEEEVPADAAVEARQVPEPIIPVVIVSPHAAADKRTPQQPSSPSASSAASSANPFEDEEEEDEEDDGATQTAPAPTPVKPPLPSPPSPPPPPQQQQPQMTGKRVFGGGMFFRSDPSSPPPSPRSQAQQPSPPSPISPWRISKRQQQQQQGRMAPAASVAAAAPVANPFENNEEEEETTAFAAAAAPPSLPRQRRVFGGGMAAALPASPLRVATSAAPSPPPPAPLPPARVPNVAAHRRFAGGLWDSGEGMCAQGRTASPQALAVKAAVGPASAPRRSRTPPPATQPQQPAPQQEAGRRSFGGQGGGWL